MHFQIFQILNRNETDSVLSGIAQQSFVDGKLTAHGSARTVKNNLQLDRTGPELSDIDNLVVSALRRNEDLQAFAFPKRLVLPIFSRYEPGMEYGSHVDGAIMAGRGGDPVRSDLAVTIFLTQPDTYDGGELVIELPFGEQEIKLQAGEAVVYPATALHRVAPVTRGVRQVAVTWIQSAVRDERLRAILYDLGSARNKASRSEDPELSTLLNKSYHNLLRIAVDP
jgi:PKHD-type hydroxylase